MPVYLLHGFRWPRPLIRIHIILQNLDDAAAEWLVAPQTTRTMLENFKESFPEIMAALPNLRFVEQYDPMDETVPSQPHAYVADVVYEVKLGVDVDEIRGRGVANEQWTAMLGLRDKLCPAEKVAWFVVVCGDEERWVPPSTPTESSAQYQHGGDSTWDEDDRAISRASYRKGDEQNGLSIRKHQHQRSSSISRGLKKVFGIKDANDGHDGKDLKKKLSFASLRGSIRGRESRSAYTTPEPPPPLPGTAH